MKKTTTAIFVLVGAMLVGNVPSPVHAAGAQQSYLQLQNIKPEVKGKEGSAKLNLTITTQGRIPLTGRAGAFGYAVMTGGFKKVLVVVTHPGIVDSKVVGAGGFHTHVLDLKEPTAKCKGYAAEVDLDSANQPNFDPGFKFTISGNRLTINDVPVSALNGARVETVATFTVKPVMSGKKPTNLCVNVVTKSS